MSSDKMLQFLAGYLHVSFSCQTVYRLFGKHVYHIYFHIFIIQVYHRCIFFKFFFQRQRNNIRIIITSMGINTLYSVLIKNLLILTKLCRVSHKKGDPNIKFTFTKIYRKLSKKNCFRK